MLFVSIDFSFTIFIQKIEYNFLVSLEDRMIFDNNHLYICVDHSEKFDDC